jgi:hypothetical protein
VEGRGGVEVNGVEVNDVWVSADGATENDALEAWN